jgi:hypothetical protein
MERHIRVIGLLYVLIGASLILLGLVVLFMFGGSAILGAGQTPGSRVVVPLVGAVGGVVFLALTLISIPALVAGVGLLRYRRWARIVVIILSGILLMWLPVGTLLGLYSLWALLSKKSEALFASSDAPG